ncbi:MULTISPECIES: HAD family hydrolase [Aerococcus]|uniref:HAD family hydrolase n=1 Tax=Aerococcus TaxID=1375 RepID=UPI000DCDAD11|nr:MULTISPECIES: HAD family hydrolase [Aerococcus]KAA9234657.1 HAD family hydrolase [Aerococcus mictus]MDK6375490.1 HAD family hydrolase [Aerococcus urinae]MDK6421085.1 HAD family hydrolase [Aerococcus urinae]MDK8074384.1 HAD family hydrolase [Aerococcus urinae]MDK8083812.1 HAD family hydrolase [Aerococcus urinae]
MPNLENVRLIAIDMDKTLITDSGELPDRFTSLVKDLAQVDVLVAIASGRPNYTLKAMFPHLEDQVAFISDNGGYVSYQDRPLYQELIDPKDYQAMARFTEAIPNNIGVLCGLDGAYVAKEAKRYDDALRYYYYQLNYVDDLTQLDLPANKFTIYLPNNNSKAHHDQDYAPKFGDDFSVAVSGLDWIDITAPSVDKGQGISHLGQAEGISPHQMLAIGDNYNDIPMLEVAAYSYAVDNAHDDIKAVAKYLAPSNNDQGVIQVMDQVLQAKQA